MVDGSADVRTDNGVGMKTTVETVEDYGTHQCHDVYTYQDNIHCPHCQMAAVWASKEIDYYEGSNYLCIRCEAQFTMPSGINDATGVYLQVIDQIKKGSI